MIYSIQRKSIVNSIVIDNLLSYFLLTSQRLAPTTIKKKRIFEEDDGDDQDINSQNASNNKIIIDIAAKCSKSSRIETINASQKHQSSVSTESTNVSLDAIKRQYGIDPSLMRAHHDAHENESKFTNPKNAYVNIESESNQNINYLSAPSIISSSSTIPTATTTTTTTLAMEKYQINSEGLKVHPKENFSGIQIQKIARIIDNEIENSLYSNNQYNNSNNNTSTISWKEKNKLCFERFLINNDVVCPFCLFIDYLEDINIPIDLNNHYNSTLFLIFLRFLLLFIIICYYYFS